jgi:hypothetical protein
VTCIRLVCKTYPWSDASAIRQKLYSIFLSTTHTMKFSFRTISTDLQSICTLSCSALAGVRRKLAVHVKGLKLPYKRIEHTHTHTHHTKVSSIYLYICTSTTHADLKPLPSRKNKSFHCVYITLKRELVLFFYKAVLHVCKTSVSAVSLRAVCWVVARILYKLRCYYSCMARK